MGGCNCGAGLHGGELVDLRWTDIDFEARVVHIADERSRHRKAKVGAALATKGRRSRMMPLLPVLTGCGGRIVLHESPAEVALTHRHESKHQC